MAITIGSALLPTGDAKLALTITAGVISYVLGTVLLIITEWIKNNGKFNKMDAFIVKLFGEAALKAYNEAGNQLDAHQADTCPAPDIIQSSIQNVRWLDNPAFGISAADQVAKMADAMEKGKCE